MDHADVERLRDRHPAWRLLRAGNAPLVLAFLGRFFVEDNNGAVAGSTLASTLDDELYALNAPDPTAPRYPKPAAEYLEDWAHADAGWLRRFYPLGSDEVHYDATPAFEKAYAWVTGLGVRPFVGTESRLHTAVELLRQIVHGAETDPHARLAELHKRRDEIDHEIAEVEAGNPTVLGPTALRDRYQQFAATARDLLSDFREVEENFRGLDRAARERIATWEGGKGDLLAELVGSRADVTGAVDYSNRRPSRRATVTGDVVLPEMRRPVPEVAVVCDTSGSMTDDLLAASLAEVEGLLRALGLARRVGVIACDTAAAVAQRVTSTRQVELTGGGGTNMDAGIAAAAALRPRPAITVVLTDGLTPWPDAAPRGMKVVVGLLGSGPGDQPPEPPAWARAIQVPAHD